MVHDPLAPKRSSSDPPGAGEFMGVGLQFVASILIFLFLGRWLDEKLGTEPWLLMAGVFFGFGASFYSIYRRLVSGPQQRAREERERGEGK